MKRFQHVWDHPLTFLARLLLGGALACYLAFGFAPMIDSYAGPVIALDSYPGKDGFAVLDELSWVHATAFPVALFLLGGVLWELVRGPRRSRLLFSEGCIPVTGDPDLFDAVYAPYYSSSSSYWMWLHSEDGEAVLLKILAKQLDTVPGDGA